MNETTTLILDRLTDLKDSICLLDAKFDRHVEKCPNALTLNAALEYHRIGIYLLGLSVLGLAGAIYKHLV
jgi:hypothetical protein